jgi:hypothetical protein
MTILAPALLLLPALAAAPFQGVLEGRMFGPHASGTSRTFVSPDGLRNELAVETPAARASGAGAVKAVSLYRGAEPDRVYVLDPAGRTYRVEPVGTSRADRKWKVARQGRGEVAGLPCEKAVLTTPEADRIDVCVSTEIGRGARWLRALQESDSGVGAGSARALARAGLAGYPLRWSLQAKGGASALTLEITAIERREVSASSFDLPPGFTEVRGR